MKQSSALVVPADADVRVHAVPSLEDGPRFVVVAASPPVPAVLDSVLAAGRVSCVLTHEPDADWPDRHGEQLAAAVLAEDGVAALCFHSLQHALNAKRRLEAARG